MKVVQATQKGDDEKRHEWVFTLYDFDGKGTPNKEVSLLPVLGIVYDWGELISCFVSGVRLG